MGVLKGDNTERIANKSCAMLSVLSFISYNLLTTPPWHLPQHHQMTSDAVTDQDESSGQAR